MLGKWIPFPSWLTYDSRIPPLEIINAEGVAYAAWISDLFPFCYAKLSESASPPLVAGHFRDQPLCGLLQSQGDEVKQLSSSGCWGATVLSGMRVSNGRQWSEHTGRTYPRVRLMPSIIRWCITLLVSPRSSNSKRMFWQLRITEKVPLFSHFCLLKSVLLYLMLLAADGAQVGFVATSANVSQLFDGLGWHGFGEAEAAPGVSGCSDLCDHRLPLHGWHSNTQRWKHCLKK